MIYNQLLNASKLIVRKSRFAPTLRKLFIKKTVYKAIEIGLDSGWDNASQWLISTKGKPTLTNPAFHSSLRKSSNHHIHEEFLLTALRKKLLLSTDNLLTDTSLQDTICTLAYQCLQNEYVWYVSDEEHNAVKEKLKVIANDINSAPWQVFAQLFLYMRLDNVFPKCIRLNEINKISEDFPKCLRKFINHYLEDQTSEIKAKESITVFNCITNNTSREVASNYEEYPYPKWTSLKSSKPTPRKDRLLKIFKESDLSFMEEPFNVLVAGCGTGYGAIEYALSYGPNAKILAIDISIASLSYAAKMAKKHNVNNIEFMQMDLLDLPKFDQNFDIIECTGVIHHMKNPTEGGKALVSRLSDNGIIHISVYSELARREIVDFRKYYNLDSNMTNEQIRQFRRQIMLDSADIVDNELSLRADFFDLNRCRDLLFHPLEHRFTVPQIGNLIEALQLNFIGFELPEIIRDQYWTHYPPKKHRHNLTYWNEFEHKNPSAFGSLYQIWAMKRT